MFNSPIFLNGWLRQWKYPIMFIYSWIPVISLCKCKPALSRSKHLNKLWVSQESNTYATVYCEKIIIIEKAWVLFFSSYLLLTESYGKAILEHQLEKTVTLLSWHLVSTQPERRKHSPVHRQKIKCISVWLFLFRKGVKGEEGLEREYI